MTASSQSFNTSGIEFLHSAFLLLLPRIELHARISFRDVRCPDRKEDQIQETVALAWKWFVRLAQLGKDASQFSGALAHYAARAVKSGRRVWGQERARDAMSPLAQTRHGFVVSSIPNGSSTYGNVFDEALQDNTQTPPDEQAAFRLDFPVWRSRRSDRDRRLIDDLMTGEATHDAAHRHGLSPGRVSQLRREFHADWLYFHGEDESSLQRAEVA